MITQNTFEHAEKIANAILCEAYVIDPDSPSPVRQRQLGKRGSVFPQDYIGTPDDVDTCYAQTECLIIGDRNTNLNVRGRTKKIVSRSVGTDMRILCSTKPIQFRPSFQAIGWHDACLKARPTKMMIKIRECITRLRMTFSSDLKR